LVGVGGIGIAVAVGGKGVPVGSALGILQAGRKTNTARMRRIRGYFMALSPV
jgi:hypothetical protein